MSQARPLTKREFEIAVLAVTGLQDKEIAFRLHIAHGTVKVHLHNVYAKLGLRNRTELAAKWGR